MLAKIGTEKRIMLSGMKQTERSTSTTKISSRRHPDRSDLPFMAVLTNLDLL